MSYFDQQLHPAYRYLNHSCGYREYSWYFTHSFLHYVCRPLFPPAWQRDDGDVGGRASILGSLSRADSLLCLSLSLLTSTGNRAIRNVPIPQCPLKHLQMYSAPICHSWECGGVSSYVPTSADGTTPPLRGVSVPPEVTLLPYYSFIPSAWWIMMMLLPYLCGNHAHASNAHSVAFHLCAGSLFTLATLVRLMPRRNLLKSISFSNNNLFSGYFRLVHANITQWLVVVA